MWLNLKGRQTLGCKFRRQHGIGPYILDFYCPELQLAIEVDGATHEDPGTKAHDRRRQTVLERQGIRFLRFTDDQVLGHMELVMEAIEREIRRLRGA